jgi:hypothetical protein
MATHSTLRTLLRLILAAFKRGKIEEAIGLLQDLVDDDEIWKD